jgi:uncharacterized protein
VTDQLDPVGPFSAMVREALGGLLDPAATTFGDMLAEDAVVEFPFAPPGGVTRLDGRAAIVAYLARLPDLLVLDRVTAPVVHRSRGEGVVVMEFEGIGRGARTGRPYHQRYISVFTVRGGRITGYRDYWNPLVVLRSVGDGPVADALRAGAAAGG